MLGAPMRLLWNLISLLSWPLANLGRWLRGRRRPRWVEVDVREPLPARPPRRGWLLGRRRGPSLAALARLLEDLGRDPHLVGVVVRLESLGGGWARAQDVRGMLGRLREAGKRVVVHLSSPGLRHYYVACAGDRILIDESGPLVANGLAAETLFWGGLLGRAGIKAEAESRGAYKSFAEVWTREDMSPAHRETIDAILDRLGAELAAAVAAARGVAPERAAELVTGGPYTAAEAERLGLVDGVAYADEVAARLGDPAPKIARVEAWRRGRVRPPRWRPLLARRRRVRVIALHGTIAPGEGREGGGRMLGDAPVRRVLEAARKDRGVAAVVLHVDSRGGSASASDLMWREVARLREAKPVVAFFGDVAASGGYYLACGASRIVAQPATLTGSIGVVAGKVSFGELYGRLGVRPVVLRRGEAATLHSTAQGFSDEERRRLAAEVDALYAQFVAKVAAGRKLDPEAAERAAQGRVWLGVDALERGLVDELGDVETAVLRAKELGRRRPGEELDVEDAVPVARHRSLLVRLLAGGAHGAGGLLGEHAVGATPLGGLGLAVGPRGELAELAELAALAGLAGLAGLAELAELAALPGGRAGDRILALAPSLRIE